MAAPDDRHAASSEARAALLRHASCVLAWRPLGLALSGTTFHGGPLVRIQIENVSKQFGEFTALKDVTLEVPKGSLTALLGPSGSGKSTLLRIIAGLETPDQGAILIDGNDVTPARPQDRGIGFVFQHYAAFNHMSVRENVAFGLRIRKRPKLEVTARVDELLKLVGLTAWASRRPAQLSGGQRQRMALLVPWPWSQGSCCSTSRS